MRGDQLRKLAAGLSCFGSLFLIVELRADGSHHQASPAGQLGKVDFPTSCAAEVQPSLEKGLALLHSFQYTESEKTFADASTRDPKCAIAHWGKAMATYHQIWDFPNDKTLKEGRKEIEKAQRLHPANAREQDFLAAAAAFFQKKSRMSQADRTQAYASALEKLHAQSPGDVEISAFYALSLISLAEQDVENIANRKKAISILDPLLQSRPDH